MTVFRHFETKMGILEALIKKNSFIPNFKSIFEEKMVWDLEFDLHLVATSYLDAMARNQFICLIAVQERTTMPKLIGIISENTKQLKEYLSKYFITMQAKRKMTHTDANAQAMAFLTLLFGYSFSIASFGTLFNSQSKQYFIQTSVDTFCNGIKRT